MKKEEDEEYPQGLTEVTAQAHFLEKVYDKIIARDNLKDEFVHFFSRFKNYQESELVNYTDKLISIIEGKNFNPKFLNKGFVVGLLVNCKIKLIESETIEPNDIEDLLLLSYKYLIEERDEQFYDFMVSVGLRNSHKTEMISSSEMKNMWLPGKDSKQLAKEFGQG